MCPARSTPCRRRAPRASATTAWRLIARSDIELEAIPDERKEAKTDFLPAVARGAAGGGAAGVLAGLVAVAIPPLGITLAGVGVMAIAGALVGSWSSALVGATVPDPVRRRFEDEIEAGRILLVVDAEEPELESADAAIRATGATPLPYEAASAGDLTLQHHAAARSARILRINPTPWVNEYITSATAIASVSGLACCADWPMPAENAPALQRQARRATNSNARPPPIHGFGV